MRLIKMLLITVVALAVFVPGSLTGLRHAAEGFLDRSGNPGTTQSDTRTYEQVCALYDVYANADASTKRTAARILTKVASRQARKTDDPALRALLGVVPVAVESGVEAQSKTARSLVTRECDNVA